MINAFFGKTELKHAGSQIRTDSGCTLAVMAITGRNQKTFGSDPACLLGTDM